MSGLLAGDIFDIFLLEKATVTTSVTYSVDGRINHEFYDDEDDEAIPFKPWSEMKSFFYEIIKGKRPPLDFKFVFHLKPSHMEALMKKKLPDADISALTALVLTVKNDGEQTTVTTGTAYSTFVMDKEPENIWDAAARKYLSDKGIPYED